MNPYRSPPPEREAPDEPSFLRRLLARPRGADDAFRLDEDERPSLFADLDAARFLAPAPGGGLRLFGARVEVLPRGSCLLCGALPDEDCDAGLRS